MGNASVSFFVWGAKGELTRRIQVCRACKEAERGLFWSLQGLQGVGKDHFWGLQDVQVKKKGSFLLLHGVQTSCEGPFSLFHGLQTISEGSFLFFARAANY